MNSNLDCDIILEDRQEAKEYNLSAGEVCEVSDLVVGDCRCRFYLKTSESAEEDEDVTTDVFESELHHWKPEFVIASADWKTVFNNLKGEN